MTWAVVQQRWDGTKWAFAGEIFWSMFKARAVRRALICQLEHIKNRNDGLTADELKFTVRKVR